MQVACLFGGMSDRIEGKDVYLEKILVDYEDILIFFLCKSMEQYYVVLCTDIKVFRYIVVSELEADVFHLLQGELPMRNVFTKSSEYWEVIVGEEVTLDTVTKYMMGELDCTVLPEKDPVFQDFCKNNG